MTIGSSLGVFAASRKPEKMRHQLGERLVLAFGERQGQIVQSDDIKLNAKPLAMLPLEPADNAIVVKGPFTRKVGFQSRI